ncbi:hypothetical protein PR048_027043 [Dryococelus australis]|uniref:Uncharacterized protein n=1 Tax=Dryococelus australis TaxID=614101 RepID=A0ABQ9GEB9_9NEOP|nr:hypothetical protein PR048_027043 [Dryococelus australis]
MDVWCVCGRYGFTLGKLVCMGFVQRPGAGAPHMVTEEYVLERGARYEVDIAGSRVAATPHLRAPYFATLPTERKYRPSVWVAHAAHT